MVSYFLKEILSFLRPLYTCVCVCLYTYIHGSVNVYTHIHTMSTSALVFRQCMSHSGVGDLILRGSSLQDLLLPLCGPLTERGHQKMGGCEESWREGVHRNRAGSDAGSRFAFFSPTSELQAPGQSELLEALFVQKETGGHK